MGDRICKYSILNPKKLTYLLYPMFNKHLYNQTSFSKHLSVSSIVWQASKSCYINLWLTENDDQIMVSVLSTCILACLIGIQSSVLFIYLLCSHFSYFLHALLFLNLCVLNFDYPGFCPKKITSKKCLCSKNLLPLKPSSILVSL